MQQRSLAPIPLATAILTALTALGYLFRLFGGLNYFPASLIFLSLLGFGVYGFFAAVLFFRRRDIMLPIAATALCLLNLANLPRSFISVWSFLGCLLLLAASLGLLVWAGCSVLEPLFEYQPLTEKLWFLPGLAAALGAFLSIAAHPYLGNLLGNLFSIAVYFLLSLTLVFPDGNPARTLSGPLPPVDESYEGPADFGPPRQEYPGTDNTAPVSQPWDGYCDMLKHVLLLVFTFAVWYFIWNYRTTRYLNQVEDEPPRTPVNQLLLCLFVPFYHIYWSYKSAQRLDRLADSRGVLSDLQVLCLVLAFFVPILPPVLMQDKMNLLSGREEASAGHPYVSPVSDEELAVRLRTYKALLDDGLITQEDYDAKKKQILGL